MCVSPPIRAPHQPTTLAIFHVIKYTAPKTVLGFCHLIYYVHYTYTAGNTYNVCTVDVLRRFMSTISLLLLLLLYYTVDDDDNIIIYRLMIHLSHLP